MISSIKSDLDCDQPPDSSSTQILLTNDLSSYENYIGQFRKFKTILTQWIISINQYLTNYPEEHKSIYSWSIHILDGIGKIMNELEALKQIWNSSFMSIDYSHFEDHFYLEDDIFKTYSWIIKILEKIEQLSIYSRSSDQHNEKQQIHYENNCKTLEYQQQTPNSLTPDTTTQFVSDEFIHYFDSKIIIQLKIIYLLEVGIL